MIAWNPLPGKLQSFFVAFSSDIQSLRKKKKYFDKKVNNYSFLFVTIREIFTQTVIFLIHDMTLLIRVRSKDSVNIL